MTHSNPHTVMIDRERLASLRVSEDQEFVRRTARSRALQARAAAHLPLGVPMSWMSGLYRTPPLYIAEGRGASFKDVDGNTYLDFNLCDLSMTIGYGNETVALTLAAQARRGAQFLLPTDDAPVVGEILAERMGLPFWQFTLSASGSNTEVIRIARYITRRPRIVIFSGHYHGHIEETLVREEEGRSVPDTQGLSPGSEAHTTILPFNDLDALERALSAGDVAIVLTEPAMTNCNVILPDPDFHRGLRELTRRYGTLLCIDEAHTFQFAFGGLSHEWRLAPDFIVLGKGFGSGMAFGLYGMSDEVAERLYEAPRCGHRPPGHRDRRHHLRERARGGGRAGGPREGDDGRCVCTGARARDPAGGWPGCAVRRARAAVEGVSMRTALRLLSRAAAAAQWRGG